MPRVTAFARAWFFPPSPRSPYKIQGELNLLKKFDGHVWNEETQLKFGASLSNSDDYYGQVSKVDTPFAARERLRAPSLLGFICKPKRGGQNRKLEFTEIGNIFLNANKYQQQLILQRQIAKVQFRSHIHPNKGFEKMNIRPLTLMIKLLLNLERLSKIEIALFVITLINHEDFEDVLDQVLEYRHQITLHSPGVDRKTFKDNYAKKQIKKIYAEDIAEGRTTLREGGSDFISTKLRTLKDYADASGRYLLATGLFTLNPHGQYFELSKANIETAKYLLETLGLSISDKTDHEYENYIKNYLGNPSLPKLDIDYEVKFNEKFNNLFRNVKSFNPKVSKDLHDQFDNAQSMVDKHNVIHQLEIKITENHIKNQALTIRSDYQSSLDDIKDMFAQISSRNSELVDRPLNYEWNTWRTMVLINDALDVKGNYIADSLGNPVDTAKGSVPDILCEYKDFWLVVEVTLQSGARQWETESEPIFRHVGLHQKKQKELGDNRPVFGLFIANKITDSVKADLISRARTSYQTYGGPVKIAPLETDGFIQLAESVLQHQNFESKILLKFFNDIFNDENLQIGELDWFNAIKDKSSQIHINY